MRQILAMLNKFFSLDFVPDILRKGELGGSSSSKSSRWVDKLISIDVSNTVPFELLYAQLNEDGKVSASDFLAQSRLALQTSNVEDYDQTSERSERSSTLILDF